MTDHPIIAAARAVMTPEQVAQIEEWRSSTVAFCAVWAAQHADAMGRPSGVIDAAHYDILQRAGARMDAFTRAGTGK